MDCHFLLQGKFPSHELNPDLSHCRQVLYQLSYTGSLKRAVKKLSKEDGKDKNGAVNRYNLEQALQGKAEG